MCRRSWDPQCAKNCKRRHVHGAQDRHCCWQSGDPSAQPHAVMTAGAGCCAGVCGPDEVQHEAIGERAQGNWNKGTRCQEAIAQISDCRHLPSTTRRQSAPTPSQQNWKCLVSMGACGPVPKMQAGRVVWRGMMQAIGRAHIGTASCLVLKQEHLRMCILSSTRQSRASTRQSRATQAPAAVAPQAQQSQFQQDMPTPSQVPQVLLQPSQVLLQP